MHVLHQTAVPTLDHWRRLQHTFQCFQTKTCHVGGRMKSFRKGHVTFRMLSIKKRLLSPLFCTKYLISCRDVRCYNSIKRSGKYSSDFVQNFLEKKRVLLCSANAWIGTHATFLLIPNAVIFWFFKVFSSSKHSWSFDQKYNYRECWCYIIRIKLCFLGTNQWFLLHVLAVCL